MFLPRVPWTSRQTLPADYVRARNRSPVSAVLAVVAIVTHTEVLIAVIQTVVVTVVNSPKIGSP